MVDPQILFSWLAGRSIARGLPAPFAEQGGFRVDTNTDAEVRRLVDEESVLRLLLRARSVLG